MERTKIDFPDCWLLSSESLDTETRTTYSVSESLPFGVRRELRGLSSGRRGDGRKDAFDGDGRGGHCGQCASKQGCLGGLCKSDEVLPEEGT